MIQTTSMLLTQLQDYANPNTKLARLVKAGNYYPIVNGLYETEKDTPGYLLAGSIYGPSYLSFDFALAYHGLIPEMVFTFTSATFEKKKKKMFQTPFGYFTYRDVPASVYPLGICLKREGSYAFQIAAPEKALCDKLYTLPPVRNLSEMRQMLTEELRIETATLQTLHMADLQLLQNYYHATNVTMLVKLLKKEQKEQSDAYDHRTNAADL